MKFGINTEITIVTRNCSLHVIEILTYAIMQRSIIHKLYIW